MAIIDGKFVYSPGVNYKDVDPQDSKLVIRCLEDFRNGYTRPLETHMLSADSLRNYLDSGSVPGELAAELRLKIQDINRELMQIVREYSQVEEKLDDQYVDSEAMHLYHAIFSGDEITDVKVNFIRLVKIFEFLRQFNQKIILNWKRIKDSVETIHTNENSTSFLEQVLEYKVYPRIELTEQTDLLLRRLAYILKIKPDDPLEDKGFLRENYSTLLSYNHGTLFLENLEDFIVEEVEDEETKEQILEKEDVNSCILDPYFLDSRGNTDFNQSYLYTLSMNNRIVTSDTKKIVKAVYIETHLSAQNVTLRQDMIRHFVSSAARKNNMEKYSQFLKNHFDFTYETIMMHFKDYNDKEKTMLFYHLGPVFFLKIIVQFLREGKTGYIHRFMNRDNMARELPFEFIKFTMKDWWDVNVFKRSTLVERNSRDLYETVHKGFVKKWTEEQKPLLQKIIEIPLVTKAYHIRDYKTLRPFLQKELSFLHYIMYSRFLGTDFLYLHYNKVPRQLLYLE